MVSALRCDNECERVSKMKDKFARKAIVFIARLILRFVLEHDTILSNDEYATLGYLSGGDFSVLDGEG